MVEIINAGLASVTTQARVVAGRELMGSDQGSHHRGGRRALHDHVDGQRYTTKE
jgi:hypothetical protein